MNILLMLHSILRWIILLVGVVAVIKFALGWLQGGAFKSMDRGLMSGFSGLMDLQATTGIIYLILILWNRNEMIKTDHALCSFGACYFPTYAVVHGVMMLAAVIVAHLPVRWKNADDATRFRNNTVTILISFTLVLIGIFILRFKPMVF